MSQQQRSRKNEFFRFAVVALFLRGAWLMVDSRPRFFLGDSESYLATAIGVWIPPDRSWIYGLVVNGILGMTHRLTAVIAAQACLSAMSCVATACLLRSLNVSSRVAWAALLLQSLDPLTHYFDRSLLTDAPAAAVTWIGLALSAAGLAHANGWLWIAAVPFLWATILLRTALLPMVAMPAVVGLGAGLWFALMRPGQSTPPPNWRSRLGPLLGPSLQAAGVVAGLAAYSMANGALTGMPPSLNAKQGYFLLGQVAPILTVADFEGLGVEEPARLLAESNHAEYRLRTWQVFGDTGMVPRMERQFGDWRRTEMTTRVLARRAILRDPVGFLRLAIRCAIEYVTPGVNPIVFATGFGLDRPLPDGMVASLRSKVREPIDADMVALPSPTLAGIRRWSHALPGLTALTMLAPVIALLRIRRSAGGFRSVVMITGLTIWAYAAFLAAFSIGYVQRYLLELTPVLVVHLGILLDDGMRRRDESPMRAE